MKNTLLFTCLFLLSLGFGQLGAQTLVDINTIAQHFNAPSGSPEDGVDYQRENAVCNNGYGKFTVIGNSFYHLGGPGVLEISAHKDGSQIVDWTAIPYQSDFDLYLPSDDNFEYEIWVRRQSNPSEYAIMAAGFYIENNSREMDANDVPTLVTHPGCGETSGALHFTGITSNDQSGTLNYVIYRTTGTYANNNSTGQFNNLTEGTYRLYVYDDGISNLQTTDPGVDNPDCHIYIGEYTLTRDIGFTAGTNSKTNLTCVDANDGTITVTPSPADTDYEISIDGVNWSAMDASPTLDGLFPDDYTVKIAKDGVRTCTLTVAVSVLEPATALSVTGSSSTDCQLVASGSGGWGSYSYRLSPSDNFVSNATFTGLAAGDYTVYVTDANGCEAQSASVVTVACVNTARLSSQNNQLSVYPNPTHGNFRISASQIHAATAQVELMDILGKVVSQQQVNVSNAAFQLEMTAPAPGIYFVRVSANGQQFLQRVVRN